MCNFTPSATICRPQQLRPETRHALIEMMRLAVKQHTGHTGPVEVNLLPDRDSGQPDSEISNFKFQINSDDSTEEESE